MILIVYAHPHPGRSEANRVLLEAVRDLRGVRIHSLYDRYPDFSIDPVAERTMLETARLVVWQHPLYWYSVPALLKLWFESVLVRGWAYGESGSALAGKDCMWVSTTGAVEDAYSPGGKHAHAFSAFVPAIEQTARYCSMNWLEPLIVHGAHEIEQSALDSFAAAYRGRLQRYLEQHG